jgi:hypothetical protein
MIICYKCKGRIFVDRSESSIDHLEVYCLMCGMRKIFHMPAKFGRSVQWLHQKEKDLMKIANGS